MRRRGYYRHSGLVTVEEGDAVVVAKRVGRDAAVRAVVGGVVDVDAQAECDGE